MDADAFIKLLLGGMSILGGAVAFLFRQNCRAKDDTIEYLKAQIKNQSAGLHEKNGEITRLEKENEYLRNGGGHAGN